MHVLTENVRQADPDERAVLAELRAGEVEKAVNWYAEHQRVKVAPRRDEVLDQMVAAWAKDVAEGKETAMLAWRRANVAALNSRARAAMAEAGRLSGPELHVDGNVYQAGDRVVTLAPSAHGQLVTSQRGTVTAVDPEAGTLTVSMDDGSTHTLGREETGPDRLAHGYATTVHRSQGATFGSAHLFADGGGRELGYVGMSRAKALRSSMLWPTTSAKPSRTSAGTGAGNGASTGPSTPARLTNREGVTLSRSKPTSRSQASCAQCSAGPG